MLYVYVDAYTYVGPLFPVVKSCVCAYASGENQASLSHTLPPETQSSPPRDRLSQYSLLQCFLGDRLQLILILPFPYRQCRAHLTIQYFSYRRYLMFLIKLKRALRNATHEPWIIK